MWVCRTGCAEFLIRSQSRERYADKVHKVVACKCHGESKRAYKYRNFENVYAETVQNLHQNSEKHQAREDNKTRICGNPCFHLRCHKREVLCAFEEHKVYYGSGGNAAENADFPLQVALIIKGEYDSRDKLNECAKEKRHCHGKEYAYYHGKGFLRIQQISHVHHTLTGRNLHECHGKCRSEEFENHRYCGGCGQAERIKYVKQNNIYNHHCHKNAHKVIDIEVFRTENAVAYHVHHSVTHHRTDKYTYCRYNYDVLEFCRFCSYCRVKKVHCIVAHSHHQVETCQQKQEYYYSD